MGMCSGVNGGGKSWLFTCRRLSFHVYLHTVDSVRMVVYRQNSLITLRIWSVKPSSLYVINNISYFQSFGAWWDCENSGSQSNEISTNFFFPVIGGFLRKLLHACCWASNTPEPLPSWFPETTSCVCPWDFKLRHTELVVLSLRSGMQLPYSLIFYDALKSVNSLII